MVENELESPQLIRAERSVAVHELWTGIQVRPDPYPVKAEASNQAQIGDHVRGAHRTEVGNERQKPGRAVDGEAIALNREPLRLSVGRRETEGNQ
jgi:hypothetical protein